MKELFADLGINVTKENMKELDELLHEYLSVDYKNCAATWKMIRRRLKEDEEGFKQRLRELLVAYA
jgi:hypothetical protein